MRNIPLKQLRKICKLSQKSFGDFYDIPLKTIQNWEADTSTKSSRSCPKYVEYLLMRSVLDDFHDEYIDYLIAKISERIHVEDKFTEAIRYALNVIEDFKLNKYIDDVILYGSVSRNENKTSSDVDILVQFDERIKEVENYSIEINRLRGLITSSDINLPENDLHIVYGDDWKQNDEAYFLNIRKEGISLSN